MSSSSDGAGVFPSISEDLDFGVSGSDGSDNVGECERTG